MGFHRLTASLLFLATVLRAISTSAYAFDVDCLRRVIVQTLHQGVEFVRPDGNIIHLLRGPGATNSAQWLRDITASAKTPEDLQRWWTGQSQGGQIWTKHVSIPYGVPSLTMSVEMTIKPGYAFFDTDSVSHQKLWEDWQKLHADEPNTFSPEQVQLLNEIAKQPMYTAEGPKGLAYLAVPNHSQFYQENNLVGVLVNSLRERGTALDCWNIVNFDGIESLHIRVPDSVDVPPDLKREYIFKYEPNSQNGDSGAGAKYTNLEPVDQTFVITSPPKSVDLIFDPYYRKYADQNGIPIVASNEVSDRAINLAGNIVRHMLSKRPDIRKNLIQQKTKVAILGVDEKFTDIPEMKIWKGKTIPIGDTRKFDDVRGGGGVRGNPVTVGCERNLCGIRDPFLDRGFSVTLHEFAHSIQNLGLTEEELDQIRAAYNNALKKRLFKRSNGENAYILSDEMEYFAGGSDLWFGTYEPQNPWSDPTMDGRERLRIRDPELYRILSLIYPADNWKPRRIP